MKSPYEPLVIERAEGAWLYTRDGRRILDAGAGAVVVNIGQGREEIARVAAEVIGRLNYVLPIWNSPDRERLCRAPRAMDPARTQSFLLCQRRFGGGRGRDQVRADVSQDQGPPAEEKNHLAHGSPITAIRSARCRSAAIVSRRADYEHVLFDWPHIPPSYCYRCPWGKTYPGCGIECATALEDEIRRHGADSIAAFIAEPMMGATGGVVPPVKEYWPMIADICRRNDILLIVDEVMTGFGRTGKRFAVEHWNLKPDVLIAAKGLTGGYMPMGMIAVDEQLIAECERLGADFMFYTYSAHPLGLRDRRQGARDHGTRTPG